MSHTAFFSRPLLCQALLLGHSTSANCALSHVRFLSLFAAPPMAVSDQLQQLGAIGG